MFQALSAAFSSILRRFQRPSGPARPNLFARLRANPVILKELRARMRGNRGQIILVVYLGLMALIITIAYLLFYSSYRSDYSYNPSARSMIEARRSFGQVIFYLVLGLEAFGVCLVSPSMTSSSITSEREHQTFDLLQTTLLSPVDLVWGKFLSGFGFVLLLLVVTLPLQSLALLFGGVTMTDLLVNLVILLAMAFGFCAVGIYCSSLFKSSKVANGLGFATPIVWVVVLPGLFLLMESIFNSSSWLLSSSYGASPFESVLRVIVQITLLSISPIATIVATQSQLNTGGNIFTFDFNINGSWTITFPAPWVLFTLLSLLMGLVLLAISVLLVQRTDN